MTTTKNGRKLPKARKPRPLSELIDDPEILEVLREPLGSPVNLTREQAIAVVQAGIGGRPDLPTGAEYVRRVRRLWGVKARD
jgi:hypothetical protein